MKKAVSITLCFAVCASLALTGCSQKKAQVISSEKGLTAVGTYPVVNQKVSVTIMTPAPSDTTTNYDTNLFTKELEQKTNVHIVWQNVQSDFNEKVNLVVASGQYPDVIDSGVGAAQRLTKSTELQLGSQKVLTPLENIINQDMPNYKKIFASHPDLKQLMTTPDKHIYNLAMINQSFHVTYPEKMWMNTTWLKNLGLNMPKTPDDFEKVLLAFKNNDANKDGKADEIPLSTCKSGSNVNLDGFLMNAFTYTPGGTDRLYLKSGKVTMSAVQSAYKDGLKYLNKLYKEGLINPESFTQDQKTQVNTNESGSAPTIGSFTAEHLGYGANLSPVNGVTSTRWQQYDAVPPLTGPTGLKTASYDPYGGYIPQIYITKNCKNPIAVCRMFDYVYSEEGTLRANAGREGKEWTKAGTGDLNYDGKQALYKVLKVDSTKPENQNISYGQEFPLDASMAYQDEWTYPTNPYDPSVDAMTGRMVVFYKAAKTYEKDSPGLNAVLPDLYYAQSDVDEIGRLKTTINDYVNEQITAFITGKSDIDANWNNYTSQLNSMGLQNYISLIQKAYDAQYGKK
jgi:putative aldouronate transport system substrate-binding protein